VVERYGLSNFEGLIKSLGPERVKLDEPLSSHTTLGIGGLADLFYEAENSGELIKAVRLAKSFEVPVTVMGSGSNASIADLGIRGLTVMNIGGKIEVREKNQEKKVVKVQKKSEARWLAST